MSLNKPSEPRVLAGQVRTDALTTKGYFFKLGSEQRCHRLGSDKMAF